MDALAWIPLWHQEEEFLCQRTWTWGCCCKLHSILQSIPHRIRTLLSPMGANIKGGRYQNKKSWHGIWVWLPQHHCWRWLRRVPCTFAEAAAAGSASAKIMMASYWDSPEAKKLFLGRSMDHRSVVEILQERIERLQQVNKSPDSWRDLIEQHDVNNLCSAFDIFITQQRCSILC